MQQNRVSLPGMSAPEKQLMLRTLGHFVIGQEQRQGSTVGSWEVMELIV